MVCETGNDYITGKKRREQGTEGKEKKRKRGRGVGGGTEREKRKKKGTNRKVTPLYLPESIISIELCVLSVHLVIIGEIKQTQRKKCKEKRREKRVDQ